MSVAARLAAFVCGAMPDASSAGAEAIMRLSLMDWAACGIAGADEPVARILRQAKLPEAAGAPVFGASDRYAPADAALINGAASHALDYDDTHFAHIGHPSVAVIPAALAVAADETEFLWAALIGAEVSVRVGLWLGRSHYQAGFHQTATAGAFGAAATAGRLLGLTSDQMQAAFGVAATQAAGLKSQFGTMGKPYHAGLAARTGVEAARLALAGFDTRGAGMDGPQGFGPTHHGEANLAAFEGLRDAWQMETVSHKFHACCHGLHAMLEALAGRPDGIAPEAVKAVTVETHPRWLSVCNIAAPATGLETKFSITHTAAMALSGHDTAALETFSDAAAVDPGLVALRGKVRVAAAQGLTETASAVEIVMADGQVHHLSHDLNAPLDIGVRTARLRAKATALVGDARAERLWAATQMESAPDLAALCVLMSGQTG